MVKGHQRPFLHLKSVNPSSRVNNFSPQIVPGLSEQRLSFVSMAIALFLMYVYMYVGLSKD
jgi:hypothetical protein